MVERIMGKIIGNYKTVVFFICLFAFALLSTISTAALREDELFEKAYENYFSYHPEKALEYFDIFLRNFPDSSALDAALFWKAKSLMQLKRTDEAIKLFTEIREVYPESPLVSFIEKELLIGENDFNFIRNNDPNQKQPNAAYMNTESEFKNYIKTIKDLETQRDNLKKNINELQAKASEIKTLKAESDEKETEYRNTAVYIQQLLKEKEALEKNIGDKDRKIAESENTIAILSEIIKETEQESSRDKLESIRAISGLSFEKVSIEDELRKKQARIDELTAQVETKDNQLRQRIELEEAKTTKEEVDYIKQTESRLLKLQSERDALQTKIEELKTKDMEIRALTAKAEEQEREKKAAEVLLEKLTAEKTFTAGKTKENEYRLAALEEELKKERSRMAELTGKDDRAEMLAKELMESEETRKQLQQQVDQLNKQMGMLEKEHETYLSRLKEAEESAKKNADTLRKLNEAYEHTKNTNRTLLEREKNTNSEIAAVKAIVNQYETPIVKMGGKQFSLRQILDDYRTSSEVTRKIKANNILWRHGSPYNDFITEHVLLMNADKSGIKEDKDSYNSLSTQYSLNNAEKEYLVRYLIINKLVNNKLSEFVTDEKFIKKYYELNKEKYYIDVIKKQVKVLSLNYSPQEEQEKGLLALDLFQEVLNGKTFENVYRENSGVLSFNTVYLSVLSDFIQNRIKGLKDGEISSVISHDNKFMIFQVHLEKPGYQGYDDVYREIKAKMHKDQKLQAYLLQEWINELIKDAEL